MKLSEEQFWKRYFQSKLFNAHRASIRSSAAQHVVKDDPIFDKYLEKDDDGEMSLKLQLRLLHTFSIRTGASTTAWRTCGGFRRSRGYHGGSWRGRGLPFPWAHVIYSTFLKTGNEKDVTMRAGRQKAALPLIRKFNEHSERLLNSAL